MPIPMLVKRALPPPILRIVAREIFSLHDNRVNHKKSIFYEKIQVSADRGQRSPVVTSATRDRPRLRRSLKAA
jgi:hypothetical protein